MADKRKYWEKNEKSTPVKAKGRTQEQIKTDRTIKKQRHEAPKDREKDKRSKHQDDTSDINLQQKQKQERVKVPDVFRKQMKAFLSQERLSDEDKRSLMKLATEVDNMNYFNDNNKTEVDHLQEMQHAIKMVRDRGFYLRDVYQDGNCLYSSLCLATGMNANQHAFMRKLIFDYIRKHAPMFKAFMPEGVEEYCAKHSKNTAWGGEIEIMAAANMLKATIMVQRIKYATLEYTPLNKTSKDPINLIYLYRTHYAALVPDRHERRPIKQDPKEFEKNPKYVTRSESEDSGPEADDKSVPNISYDQVEDELHHHEREGAWEEDDGDADEEPIQIDLSKIKRKDRGDHDSVAEDEDADVASDGGPPVIPPTPPSSPPNSPPNSPRQGPPRPPKPPKPPGGGKGKPPKPPKRNVPPAPHKLALVKNIKGNIGFKQFRKVITWQTWVNPDDENAIKRLKNAGVHPTYDKRVPIFPYLNYDYAFAQVRGLFASEMWKQIARWKARTVRINSFYTQPWILFRSVASAMVTPFTCVGYRDYAPKAHAPLYPNNGNPDVEAFFLYNSNRTSPTRFDKASVALALANGSKVIIVDMSYAETAGTIFGEFAYVRTTDHRYVRRHSVEQAGEKLELIPNDWLWNSTTASIGAITFSWTKIHAFQNIAIFVCNRGPADIVVQPHNSNIQLVQAASFPPPPLVVEHLIRNTGITQGMMAACIPSLFINMLPSWLIPQMHLMKLDVLKAVMAKINSRPHNTLTYKQIHQATYEVVNRDPTLNIVGQVFPDEGVKIVQHMANTVFHTNAKEDALHLETLAIDHAGYFVRSNQALDNIGKQPQTSNALPTILKTFAMVGVAAYLTWRYKPAMLFGAFKPVCNKTTIQKVSDTALDMLEATADKSLDLLQSVLTYCDNSPLPHLLGTFIGNVVRTFTNLEVFSNTAQICLLLPFIEESIKHLWPTATHLIAGGELLAYMANGATLPMRIPALLMHYYTARQPLQKAFKTHMAFNTTLLILSWFHSTRYQQAVGAFTFSMWISLWRKYQSSMNSTPSAFNWQEWRDYYYRQPIQRRTYLPVQTTFQVPILSDESDIPVNFLPAQTAYIAINPEPNIFLQWKSTIIPLPLEPDYHSGQFVMFTTQVPFYRPDCSKETILVTAHARTLAMPPTDPVDPLRAWREMPIIVNNELPIIWEEVVDAWLDHHKDDMKKWLKYKKYCELYKKEGPEFISMDYSIKMEVKKNEVLFRNTDGMMELKPRPLSNVPPEVQVMIGPYIYEASKRLKQQWALYGEPREIDGWLVDIVYGGCLNDYQLSLWASKVHIPKIKTMHVMVGGDDSYLVVWDEHGRVFMIEGDFKMFDQSQSVGPLVHENRVLWALGVPSNALDIVMSMHKNRLVFYTKDPTQKLKINRDENPSRATGGPETSDGNSINNAAGWIKAITRVGPNKLALEAYFKNILGFECKIKFHDSFFEGTFLKGIWLPAVPRFQIADSSLIAIWTPLPSRILKMGKSFDRPCTIYRTKDANEADAQYMSDVASSYAPFCPMILTRSFVCRFKNRKIVNNLREKHQIEHQPEAKGDYFWKAYDVSYEYVFSRYSIEQNAVERVEYLIQKIPMYTMLVSPIFDDLARIDYA